MKFREYISCNVWAYNLLAAMAFILPVSKRIMPAVIALALLFSVYRLVKSSEMRNDVRLNLKASGPMAMLAILYLLHVIGLVRTDFPGYAFKELEYKLSFLIFPLLYVLMPPLAKAHRRKLLDVFTIGCLVFLAVSLGVGIWRSLDAGSWEFMTYQQLGYIFHPTYMSAYQGIALFHLLTRGIRQEFLFSLRYFHWAICGLVVIYIALLASKAGIISTAGILAFFIWMERSSSPGFRRALLASFCMLGLMIASSWLIPVTSGRLRQATTEAIQQSPVPREEMGATSSTALRKVCWSAAGQLLITHPAGAGTGNATHEMVGLYLKSGEEYAAKRRLNAHNQFLQTGAELGWPGLICLAGFLIWFMKRTGTGGEGYPLLFVGLMSFHFLFESFLEVQAGIVFFSFWSLVFLQRREGKPSSGN